MAFSEEEELARARQAEDERLRREEDGKFEAARRERARALIAEGWQGLHAALEPPTRHLEADENDATVRFLPEDTVESALARELGRALGAPAPSWMASRILGAYDPESALEIGRLPDGWVTAERIYAHVVSFGWPGISPSALASVARRLTVILLNKHWLLPLRAASQPLAPPEPAPAPAAGASAPGSARAELELCLDCGADLSVPGPRCDACAGVSADEAQAPPPPPPAPAPPRGTGPGRPRSQQREGGRARSGRSGKNPGHPADRTMVLDFTGDPRPLPPGVGSEPEPRHEGRARQVVGYARVLADIQFAGEREVNAHGGVVKQEFVTLAKGTVVEVMEPSERDKKDLERRMAEGRQLVTIRWDGKPRLVEASSIERASPEDFLGQEKT